MYFRDRHEAGQCLAQALTDWRAIPRVLVLGIPRGGVVVAYPVARALNAELDVCLTHKLGAPGNPELAIGAVAEDGTLVLDDYLIKAMAVSDGYIAAEAEHQRRELARRASVYRGDRAPATLTDRPVVVIDDGVATGATMVASLQALAAQHPATLVAAVPVAPQEAIERLRTAAHRVECLYVPELFWSVGSFYDHFGQVSDEEVIALLNQAWRGEWSKHG